MGETPVPIPNTTVKTHTADGTALETVWKSRRPPVLLKKARKGSVREEAERQRTLKTAYTKKLAAGHRKMSGSEG